MTITLCIISKNEEKTIGAAIDSVKEIVDEIVVGDTGSTDGTRKIAQSRGAKVIDIKWDNDFSSARNEVLGYATKEWVLVLDCDEEIAKEDIFKLRELTQKGGDAYSFHQRNYTDNSQVAGFHAIPKEDKNGKGHSGFYVSTMVRLFRNGKGYKFLGAVHELVENSIRERKGSISDSKIPIHHSGNADPKKAGLKHQQYYSLAKRKADKEQSPEAYMELGVLAKGLGKDEEAKAAFEHAVDKDKNQPIAYYELGLLLKKKGKTDDALKMFLLSLEAKPSSATFMEMGLLFLTKGDLKSAYANLIKAAMLNANNPSIYNAMGIVHERNGKFIEAAKMYELCVKLNPKNSLYYSNLGNALAKSKNLEPAMKAYELALEFGHPKMEQLQKMVGELRERLNTAQTISFIVHIGDEEKQKTSTPNKPGKQTSAGK